MKILDIDVRIHWSFLALLGIFAYKGWDQAEMHGAVTFTAMVMIAFFFVLLHEFGHALAARHYGIKTNSIVLYPLGGVASLERMPKESNQEFFITLWGPLVNAASAIVLLALQWLIPSLHKEIGILVTMNVLMAVFNLLPAFPMDGGRILRSSLYYFTGDYLKATTIATILGRICAVGFVIFGIIYGIVTLPLIGLFVYMAAHVEQMRVDGRLEVEEQD
jgi:Zn-dependent protease